MDGAGRIADTWRMYSAETAPATAPDSPVAVAAADVFAAVPAALKGALQRRGFSKLTEVQAAVLAADDGAADLRISSQTGSGKTVALGLALAARVAGGTRGAPTTLVVTPTRELAAQVKEELSWLFADLVGVRCEVVTGGTSIARERQQLSRGPSLVVGTPGRLLDHVRNGALSLGQVNQLVLDEADQMLDLGFKDELDAILAALPPTRRTHLVSATFPAAVRALADRFQRSPKLVAGTPAGASHGDIEHIAVKVGSREHYAVLVNLLLLAGDERTLVFVRTREDTSALADKLAGDGFLALPIHGDLAQAQRTRTLQAFRRGTIHTLIATDVAARGLDIADVTTVVHFDPPIDAETYVHRSGRTGRAGQKGRSYMLVMKSRANFVRRLYYQARIEADLQGAPGAAEVRAMQQARAAQRALALVAELPAPTPELRATAARLLAGRDPVAVVAAMVAHASAGVREPFEVAVERAIEPGLLTGMLPGEAEAAGEPGGASEATPDDQDTLAVEPAGELAAAPEPGVDPALAAPTGGGPRPAAQPATGTKGAPAQKKQRPARPASAAPVVPAAGAAQPVAAPMPVRKLAAEQRGRAGAAPSWQRKEVRPRGGAPFAHFRINWGARDGADPRRVLAHVCRRTGIEGHLIGAIDVHANVTTFGVAVEVVADFERKAARPDRRDPHLVIVRDRFGER